MDFKDTIIVIGGFIFGPLAAFIVTVVVAFVEMVTVDNTAHIGFLMNVISGTAFACTASFIYSKKRTLTGAMIGLLAGTILMTIVMMLWNYILTPIFMNMPREFVATMIFPIIMPFNIFKAVVNSALILLLYKPIATALRSTGLMPKEKAAGKEKGKIFNPALVAISLFLLLSSTLWYMANNEIGPFRSEPAVVENGYGDYEINGYNGEEN